MDVRLAPRHDAGQRHRKWLRSLATTALWIALAAVAINGIRDLSHVAPFGPRQVPARVISLAKSPPEEARRASAESGAPALRMAVVPLLAPERSIEAYQALARYLGAKLGRPTELVVRTSQADASELVRARQVDLAFVDAYAFVRGEREFGMRVVAAPSSRGRPTYQSYIVARRSSATGSLLDARGARFASADLLSSSGWLFPATWLTAHGEDPRRFFSRIITTGSDDQSLDLVVSGQADAASVSSMVYDRVAAEGTLVANTTRVVQHSPSIATPPVVAHPEMDADLLRRVRATLVAMDADPDGRKALDGVGFDGFVVPERGLYDSIRTMAAERERP